MRQAGRLVDDFDAKAAAVCKAVKDAGARVPGDRSAAEAAARVKADALPIPTKIWESITRTAERRLARVKARTPASRVRLDATGRHRRDAARERKN